MLVVGKSQVFSYMRTYVLNDAVFMCVDLVLHDYFDDHLVSDDQLDSSKIIHVDTIMLIIQ